MESALQAGKVASSTRPKAGIQSDNIIVSGDFSAGYINIVLWLQTVAWLDSAPSVLGECIQLSTEDLSFIYQHYKSSGLLKMACK